MFVVLTPLKGSAVAKFVTKSGHMQRILARKYPFLLIDESQDTKKELVDAFFQTQERQSECFALGMFGDTMQRIYTDGKADLGEQIPDTWAKPAKTINYRCPKRVIQLINKIRAEVDGQEQVSGKEMDGTVRLFIVDTRGPINKAEIEGVVLSTMAECAGDVGWQSSSEVKILTLEHHMAAARGGFSAFFDPLYAEDQYKTGLLDGSLSGVGLFANQVLPLIEAKKAGDEFTASDIVRSHSPLLKKDVLKASQQPVEDIPPTQSYSFSKWFSLREIDK